MSKTLSRSCVLFLSMLLVQAPSLAQAPSYFSMYPQGTSMRAAGLADASCADPRDVSSMYWNPGVLSFLRAPSFVLTHRIDQVTHGQYDQVAVPVLLRGPLDFGVSAIYNHGGTFIPDGASPVTYKEYGADIASSAALLPTLSIGVLLGARKVQFGDLPAHTGWGQVGVFYYPSPGVSYGMAYRISSWATYWSANAQSGVAQDPRLRQNLEVGASMSYPANAERSIVTLSLATEKYFPGVSVFSTKGGLELCPFSFVALRVGFKVGTVERIARYGIGLRFDPVQLDFAVGPTGAEPKFSGLSMMITL